MTGRWTRPALLASGLAATVGLATTGAPVRAGDSGPGPRVFSATIVPDDIRPGIVVGAVVDTSADVTSVVAEAAGHTIPIPRVDARTFRGTTTTPRFPRFIHCHLKVTFVARNAAGVQVRYPTLVKVN